MLSYRATNPINPMNFRKLFIHLIAAARPITIKEGTNQLCSLENLEDRAAGVLSAKVSQGNVPEFWDGQTAGRVFNSMKSIFEFI